MDPEARSISLDAFAIRIGVAGLCAIISAVFMLALLVTPAHRGGGPILSTLIAPLLDSFGIDTERFTQLRGENQPVIRMDSDVVQPRFVVRFVNAPEAERALRVFRENRTKGRQIFAEWAETTEGVQGFRLATLTPSGEAVLAYEPDEKMPQSPEDLKALQAGLRSAPGVSFADPYPFNASDHS